MNIKDHTNLTSNKQVFALSYYSKNKELIVTLQKEKLKKKDLEERS